jgi:hypothetical protein
MLIAYNVMTYDVPMFWKRNEEWGVFNYCPLPQIPTRAKKNSFLCQEISFFLVARRLLITTGGVESGSGAAPSGAKDAEVEKKIIFLPS